jgi:PAS domain S-box-containing protein
MASFHVDARIRQFGAVGVLLVLSVAGFFLTRALGQSDARRESARRADIAAVRLRDSVVQAETLVDGVRGFLVSEPTPLTQAQFVEVGVRWLGPSGLPAAAWVERVPAAARAAYERRIGHRIVAPTRAGAFVPVGPRTVYYPATFVTRSPPLSAVGIDLGGVAGVVAAIARPQTAYQVSATPLVRLADGTTGIFLVQAAQRVDRQIFEPGFAVVFAPASWLLSAATDSGDGNVSASSRVEIKAGGVSVGDLLGAASASSRFTEGGISFEVLIPRSSISGSTASLPWIVLAGGLLLAGIARVLGLFATRREKATAELDRLFTLTPDLIVVAGFDGYFKRVNPAFEASLGYSEEEALARPSIEFVHPDDRRRTEAEHVRLSEGAATTSFENRCLCKDGSYRWIDWTAIPVQKERQTYAVGRDVTARRQAEADLGEAEERNRLLAEEQTALRRVATLVARGAPPTEVFAAVAEEVGRLVGTDRAVVSRYEPDDNMTILAGWSPSGEALPEPDELAPIREGGVSDLVRRTGQAVRIDGEAGGVPSRVGIRSAVGVPITVQGRLWGLVTVGFSSGEPSPQGTEERLAKFTELVGTAIANAQARAELTASRARVVATADETRRRIERDLHDGAQQRLVSLALRLRAARTDVPPDLVELDSELDVVAQGLDRALSELREFAHGIHPAGLAEGGLESALRSLAGRSVVPVQLDVRIDRRLSEPIEIGAYYVVSEALANATKHANASVIAIEVAASDGVVELSVRDDGVGGADPMKGSGIVGLRDRVEAIGGSMELESPVGAGTVLRVRLPLD